MNHIVTAILWIASLGAIYFGAYILNKRTPKPAGCEELTAGCGGCQQFDCTHNKAHTTMKEGLQ